MLTSQLEPIQDTFRRALPTLISRIQRALDSASAEDTPAAVGKALRECCSVELLSERQQEGDTRQYTRHLLYAHPSGLFTVVALVWMPGQITPVHGHYTWCSYIVLKGAMSEEHFSWNRELECASRSGEVARNIGDVVTSHAGLEQVHRLRNVGADVAISVHVYGVDAQRVATHVNRIATLA